MTRFPVLCAVFLIICSAHSDAQSAGQRTQPGSFLSYCVTSSEQLADQIRQNPGVARRYGRHFGIPPETVADYFRHNLQIVTLDKPHKTTVYFVSARGKVTSKTKTIPAGTRVFALPDGRPVLELVCGNPLSTKLTRPTVKPYVEVKPPPAASVLPTAQEVMPLPAPYDVALAPVGSPVAGAAQPLVAAPPPSLLRFAAPLLLGGAFVAIGDSEGGPPDEVIPEFPAPVLTALGGLALALCAKVASSRRRT